MPNKTQPLPPLLPTPSEFTGKIALVTGGSKGIGAHLSASLAKLGADVFFCGRDEKAGKKLARKIGKRGHFIQCDLASNDGPADFAKAAGAFKGRIDYLVNNVATDPVGEFEKVSHELFEKIWRVDMRSYFFCAQAALPFLEKGTGKAVVNISTTSYLLGWPDATAYDSAKGGIVGFSRCLARYLGPRGIRVNTLSPGWIMTERQLREKVSQHDKDDLLATQCVKELMTEAHVTPATLFLLSRAAAGIAGQNLVVDGGKYFH
jgi:NAD(P)-dependent dehydrogenase (short-subunit alcohol dehydrogenase family)